MKPEVAAAWQAYGAMAQVVVAFIALTLAYRANSLNKGSAFAQHVVATLFNVLAQAREVRGKYRRMFEPFESVAMKRAFRSEWLKTREGVLATLHELALILPAAQPCLKAWQAVEAEEDTHTGSDAVRLQNGAPEALKRYDAAHEAFVTAVATLMREELK